MGTNDCPLVSVLLPVFDCEAHISDAVASITAQTYENLEIVVIDDGSSDGTAGILARFSKLDSRVKIFRTENHGLVAALNTAMAQANGELAARMDGDDIAEPQRIARQVAHMLEYPDCVAVGSNTTDIDAAGQQTERQPDPRSGIDLSDRCLGFRHFPPAPPSLNHPSAMVRMAVLRQVGGYRPYFKRGAEDRDLWWRLSAIGTLHCLPERLLRYRQHPNNRSVTLKEGAIADALVCDLSAVCRFYSLDDTAVLEDYAAVPDLPAAVAAYETLVGGRYPVWALHAYRVLRRRSWSLSGSSSEASFKAQAVFRALSSLSSRPSWYVLVALLR
jgi:glycosyltransferase involved in cell wall biosynthesis